MRAMPRGIRALISLTHFSSFTRVLALFPALTEPFFFLLFFKSQVYKCCNKVVGAKYENL